MMKEGKTTYIDPRIKTRSFEEGKLVEIMERCWTYKADDRPTVFEIVEFLRNARLDSLKRKEDQTSSGK